MSQPLLFTLVPLTDAVPGVLVDPSDASSFFLTVQVGSTVYRAAHFVNGAPDPAFASELPPPSAGSYVFTAAPTDVLLLGARVDNAGQDAVFTLSLNGTVSDFIRVQVQGGTLYPVPTNDIAQNPDRTLKIIAPPLVPAPVE